VTNIDLEQVRSLGQVKTQLLATASQSHPTGWAARPKHGLAMDPARRPSRAPDIQGRARISISLRSPAITP